MNKRLAKYRAWAEATGKPFPFAGPALPDGWMWVYQRPGAAHPSIAAHELHPLTVYQVGSTWRADIGSKRLRVSAEGRYGLVGAVQAFRSANDAAFTVTAHWTWRQREQAAPEYVEIIGLPGLRWQVEGSGDVVCLRPAFVAIRGVSRDRIKPWE